MSDAEQAHAFRTAVEYLVGCGHGRSESVRELRRVVNVLDPPETVQSLREELRQSRDELAALSVDRDALAAERDEAREKQAHLNRDREAAWEQMLAWYGDSKPGMEDTAAERGDLAKKLASIESDVRVWRDDLADSRRLLGEVRERQDRRESAGREPRVWDDDEDPTGVEKVRDSDGYTWERQAGAWITPRGRSGLYHANYSWRQMLDRFGPLTEVLL